MHWKCDRVLWMVALFVLVSVRSAVANEIGVEARVSRVKDGNTFIARTEHGDTRIYELLAAVAPLKRLGQPGWKDAEDRLRELIEGKSIRLRAHTIGGQNYAIVDQDEGNLNQRMIKEGHAWLQPKHIRGGPYAVAEGRLALALQHAKRAREGIWAAAVPPIEPWRYEDVLRQEAVRQLKARGPAWSIAPQTTGALVVVRDMILFSDKLDRVAHSIDMNPPGVLDYAIQKSKFNAGLNRHGSLMWWFDPVTRAETYAIPALGGEVLIGSRLGKYEPYMSGKIEGDSYQAFALKNYGLFSQSEPWLKQCAESKGGLDVELSELTSFIFRQDIALAARGSVDGLPFDRLPFTKGDGVVSDALQSTGMLIQQFVPGFTKSSVFAAGTELLPPDGARVSLAAAVDKASVAAKWPQSMTTSQDTLFQPLPDLSPGLVLALCSCDSWNEALKDLFDDEVGPPIEFADLRGLTLMLYPYLEPKSDNLLAGFRADIHVENAGQSFQVLTSFLQATFRKANGAGQPKFELAEVDLDGRPVLEITITNDKKANLPEPMKLCIAVIGDSRIIVQGGALKQLQIALTNPEGRTRLVESARIQPTLALLGNDPQQVLLLDIPNVGRLVTQVLSKLSPNGNNFLTPMFDFGNPEKIPPLGASGHFDPSAIEVRVAAPTGTLKYLAESGIGSRIQLIPQLLMGAARR